MKWILSLAFFLFLSFAACAQYYDSVSFVSADWKVQKIHKKVKLYRYHFNNSNLFRSNENISYVLVKKGRANSFHVAAEPQKLRTVSDFAEEVMPVAAINGNFFDVKKGGAVDHTKVNGVLVNTSVKGAEEKLSFHQKAAVVIDKGRLEIKKWDGLVNWEEWLKEPDIMVNGPLLLYNGVNELLDSSSFNTLRHPRTCVGITKRGHLVMLVVDGRSAHSAGMNLFELTKIMRWLGCRKAINFDGGGSATLWVAGKGVINYPSDNKKWDHEGERKVANIFYVKGK